MNKILKFDILNAEIVEELDISQFATVRVDAFSTGKTLHNTTCDFVALKKTASTIYEKPLIFEYDSRFGDFGSHNAKTTIPAGFVVPNSAEFINATDGSERITLRVFVKIWKKYSGKFLKVFSDTHTKSKSVSVELEIINSEEAEDGLLNLLDWKYAAICALGDYVSGASPGANMELLSFAKDESKKYEQAYIAEFASRYDELDFKIPDEVKKNAQEGLDLHKKHGRGGTSVALSNARHITKNEFSQPEKVRSLAKHFTRHADDNLENKEGSKWIAWQLWGGNEGLVWSRKLVESMDKIDRRKLAYFGQEGDEKDMPYKKISEINPALAGIEPKISLADANKIAKQADAIGGEYGWPTAIKHFKDTHKIVDGKWIEKSKEEQKMADEELKKPEEMAVPIPETEKPVTELMAETPPPEKPEEEKKEEEKEKKEEEKEFSFAGFANLIAYMEEEPEAEEEKMAAEELKKEKAVFATVVSGMYAKMCKMAAKVAQMAEEKVARDAEMSALKEFKANIEAQQKQFAIDETLRELDSRVIILDEARTEMLADAEKYSFAEINIWQNNCKAKSFDFALKTEKSDKSEIKRYAMPFTNLPKPANNGSVWPAKT